MVKDKVKTLKEKLKQKFSKELGQVECTVEILHLKRVQATHAGLLDFV